MLKRRFYRCFKFFFSLKTVFFQFKNSFFSMSCGSYPLFFVQLPVIFCAVTRYYSGFLHSYGCLYASANLRNWTAYGRTAGAIEQTPSGKSAVLTTVFSLFFTAGYSLLTISSAAGSADRSYTQY